MMLIGSMIRIRERIVAAPGVAAVVHVVLDGDPLFWLPAGQAAGSFVDDLRTLRRSDSAVGRAMRASAVSAARPPAPARSLLQINLSSFAYLFSEIVQYCQSRVSNIGELERK